MDIQSKVAARRAELARGAKEAARRQREKNAAEEREAREHRRNALEQLASELSLSGTPVRRQSDDLEIAEASPLQALDPQDFKKDALRRMLTREARQRFTPAENWYVIAPIAAGVALLLSMPLLGLVLIGLDFVGHYRNLDRYRRALISEFPKLFGTFAEMGPRKS